jgi:hypothetical protein
MNTYKTRSNYDPYLETIILSGYLAIVLHSFIIIVNKFVERFDQNIQNE